MKRILAVLIVLSISVLFTACGEKSERVKEGSTVFTEKNMPVVCYDSLSERQASVLSGAALGSRPENMISENSVEGCLERLTAGECNIAFVTLTPDEESLLSAGGYTYAKLSADALAVVTGAENTVSSLSKEQIISVLNGSVTNWSEIGGADESILLYMPQTDGICSKMLKSYTKMTDEVGGELRTVSFAGSEYKGYKPFEARSGSLGFMLYSYANSRSASKSGSIKILSVDGIAPDTDNISGGTYPVCCNIYVVRKSDIDVGSATRVLYDWMLSDEGREILRSRQLAAANG